MIQPATLLDLPAVYHLERQIFPKDAYPYLDLFVLFCTPGVVNLKAVDAEGKLLGFVSGARAWLPFLPSWVVTLGVAQEAQRQGLGEALLRACEARLAPRRIRLTVRRSNKAALGLYHKCGYAIIQVREGYYPDGEDGLVMEQQSPTAR